MKILLIAPASGKWRQVGRRRLFNGRTFRFSMLSLLRVAAETPAGHQLKIVDEQVDAIPWKEPWDLVGITCMTALAPHAYELAAQFRERGTRVVLGGMHPTLCPEEAQEHADAAVAGEAEDLWPRVVQDAAAGCLQPLYRSATRASLAQLKPAPRHLLPAGHYATVQAVEATRGCPHQCEFCSISACHQHEQRRRPIEEVAAEIARLPGKFFILIDDNFSANPVYAQALMEALIPLKKRWISQSTLEAAQDPTFVERAAQSGCIGLFVGLETFSQTNLGSVSKSFHRVEVYRQTIERLHTHGIGVEAGIIFGLPGDTAEVFGRTLQALDELRIDAIQVSIFTPLPGTPAFARMEDRILDRNWAHYDFHHVVYEPERLSAEALQAGHDWITREFYRPWRMARRLAWHSRRPRSWSTWPYVAAVNLAYYGRTVTWGIRGWNPAEESIPLSGPRQLLTASI